MKPIRIFILLLSVYAVVAFAGCKKHPDAETTALHFFDVLYNEHDLDEAETLVTESSKEKLRNDFKFIEGALQIVKDKQPVHYKYSVENEKTQIKNDSAFVTIKTVDDGSEMKILLLQISGDWKIDLNYDENDTNAALKPLTDSVLEIMKSKQDSIIMEK